MDCITGQIEGPTVQAEAVSMGMEAVNDDSQRLRATQQLATLAEDFMGRNRTGSVLTAHPK